MIFLVSIFFFSIPTKLGLSNRVQRARTLTARLEIPEPGSEERDKQKGNAYSVRSGQASHVPADSGRRD